MYLSGVWLDVDLRTDIGTTHAGTRLDYYLSIINHSRCHSQHNWEGPI